MTALVPISVAVMVLTFIMGLLGGFPVSGGVIGDTATGPLEPGNGMEVVLDVNDMVFRSYTSVVEDVASFQGNPDLARAEARRELIVLYANTLSAGFRELERQLRQQLEELTADLVLSKMVNDPAPVEGSAVIFILTVTNLGPADATGIVVLDELPTGVTYSVDTGDGDYDPASGAWTIGSLPIEASTTLQIMVTIDSDTAGMNITNAATIAAMDQADPSPDNNSASAVISVTVQ